MANLSITTQRNQLTLQAVQDLEKIFQDNDIEFFRTGANLNTITYVVGEIDGKEVYGSIKFTLHKSDYDLDEEIEEYEMLLEERDKKAKEKELRNKKALKDREERARKAAEKKEIEERAKEKRRKALEEHRAALESAENSIHDY